MKYIKILIIILFISFAIFFFSLDKETEAKRIPVITFHRLVEDNIKKELYHDTQWVGSIDVFESMMKYLYDNHYKTISTEEFYKWYKGELKLPKKTVLITFDDGFSEDYYLAYPILKKYNFKATSFIVGSRVEDITPKYDKYATSYIGQDVIDKLKEEYPNFEFQSHSYNMHFYTEDGEHRIRSMSEKELEEDIILNEKFGFKTFAYPFGDYNDTAKKLLEKHNYLVAFRFGPRGYAYRSSDRYAIPRIKINGENDLAYLKQWLNY